MEKTIKLTKKNFLQDGRVIKKYVTSQATC